MGSKGISQPPPAYGRTEQLGIAQGSEDWVSRGEDAAGMEDPSNVDGPKGDLEPCSAGGRVAW